MSGTLSKAPDGTKTTQKAPPTAPISNDMNDLQNIPSPGVGILPHLVAKRPETIRFEVPRTRAATAHLSDGTPLVSIDKPAFGFSQKRTVTDANGKVIGAIRRETGLILQHGHYFEMQDGRRLIDVDNVSQGFLRRRKAVMRVQDLVGGAAGVVLEYLEESSKQGHIEMDGQTVATVIRTSSRISNTSEFAITVSAGMDMFIPITFVLVLVALQRAKAAAGAAGAAGGAGA